MSLTKRDLEEINLELQRMLHVLKGENRTLRAQNEHLRKQCETLARYVKSLRSWVEAYAAPRETRTLTVRGKC